MSFKGIMTPDIQVGIFLCFISISVLLNLWYKIFETWYK